MTLRRLSSIATALAALAILAGPAWSARVVEVRVGSHPKFTRVVFELDAPAGYRIERRAVDGGHELVVELAAASAPRRLESRSPVVAGVALEPSGSTSVARVQLRGGVPRVKELILGGPPRIVLDFMLPEEATRTAAAPSDAAKAEPAVAVPPVVAKTDAPDATPAPKPAEKPQRVKPVEQAPPVKPVEKAAPSQPVEKPQRPAVAANAQPPVATPKPPAPPTPLASKQEQPPVAPVDSALDGERIVEPKVARPDALEAVELASPAPVPGASPPALVPPKPALTPPSATPPTPAAKAPATPAPMRAKAEPSGPFGLDLAGMDSRLALGLVGAGLLLFLFVVIRLLRRHTTPTSLAALEHAREAGEPQESGYVFETIASVGRAGGAGTTASFPVAGPGLFDDEREKGESEMDVVMDLPIERGARPSSMAPNAESGALMQELERRMAQLESRLDEANEARELLERQVTAQSEELRVQRAAIARTQRALRGMTRVGEEQATEPALRDPSKPSAGRG
jgi:hypothetical protein